MQGYKSLPAGSRNIPAGLLDVATRELAAMKVCRATDISSLAPRHNGQVVGRIALQERSIYWRVVGCPPRAGRQDRA